MLRLSSSLCNSSLASLSPPLAMMKREPELLAGLSARPASFQYPQDVVWADDEASSSAVVLPVQTPQPKKKKAPSKTSVFVCTELHCGKTFPRSFALRRHLRIHTGNKPYACDFEGCTQRFNTSGNLSRHKRIHSGERPYPCIFATCGKRFNTSTKLKRHMRIHFPEGQNLFRCVGGNCNWSCDNYKEFAQHQKLNHNVIVGAQLENATRRAEAAAAAAGANPASAKDNDYFPVADTTTPSGGRMDYDHQQNVLQPQSYNPASSFLYGGGSYAAPEKPKQPRKIMGSYFPSDMGGLASLPVLKTDKKPLDVELSGSSGGAYDMGLAASRRAKPPSAAFPSSSYQSRTPSSSSTLGYDSFTLTDSSSTSSYASRSTLLPSTSYSNHYTSQWRTDDDEVGPDSDDYGHPQQQQQQSHPQQQNNFNSLHHLAPHHVLRPPPTSSDDAKYGSFQVPPPMNPAAPDFTGEELSAVLQLMNDPYP